MSNDPERSARRKAFLALSIIPGSTFTGMGPGGSIVTLDRDEFEEVMKAIALISEIESIKQFVTLLSTSSSLAEMIFPEGTSAELHAVSGTLEGFADAMGEKINRRQQELDEL